MPWDPTPLQLLIIPPLKESWIYPLPVLKTNKIGGTQLKHKALTKSCLHQNLEKCKEASMLQECSIFSNK